MFVITKALVHHEPVRAESHPTHWVVGVQGFAGGVREGNAQGIVLNRNLQGVRAQSRRIRPNFHLCA